MHALLAALIFAATYLVMAVGRVPGWQVERAGAAFIGAVAMVATGVLPLADAFAAIDLGTILLLLGMMVVAAALAASGFFALATEAVAARVRHPLALLAAIVAATALLSALLVNDTVCLVLAPLVLAVARRLRRDPVPYLIAVALAANVGGAATLTGNPQNMIVGAASAIPYRAFAASLTPPALFGVALAVVLVALLWPGEFLAPARLAAARLDPPVAAPESRGLERGLVAKGLAVALGLVVALLAGVPPPEAALAAAALSIASRRLPTAALLAAVDWQLLVMFSGLFVVVRGLEARLLTPDAVAAIGHLALARMPLLALVTAALSNIVSNVPAVLVLKPFVAALPDAPRAWRVVAMASTFAGNFTILGSVANLIVVQQARAEGVEIGFWTYWRVGAPLTLATIGFGLFWL
ncbi:MAG: anion transporter [Rhodospirillales bacterium]|nr:anion transporter [Rhodospirillales bacterium]